jgi:hypothetical protein
MFHCCYLPGKDNPVHFNVQSGKLSIFVRSSSDASPLNQKPLHLPMNETFEEVDGIELDEDANEAMDPVAAAQTQEAIAVGLQTVSESGFTCPDPACQKTFSTLIKFKRHIIHTRAHKGQPNYEELVHYVMSKESAVHEQVQVLCPLCNSQFPVNIILKHLKLNHASHPSIEDLCVQSSQLIIQHLSRSNGPCPFCDKTFSSTKHRKSHMRFRCPENPNKERLFACCMCCFTTVSEERLDAHIKTHAQVCKQCGELFENADALLEHQHSAHPTVEGGTGSVTEIDLDYSWLITVSAGVSGEVTLDIDSLFAQDMSRGFAISGY